MKITKHCYAVLGLGYFPPWTVNSGIAAGENITAIIDTGPSYTSALTILGYAASVKPANEIIVINTEKHLDHIGGNSLFKNKGIKISGHPKIYRNPNDLKEDIEEYNKSIINKARRDAGEEKIFYKNTEIVNPEYYLNDKQEIRLGENLTAVVLFTPGHTETNISIYLPEDKVLYCGDCLTCGYLPNLEGGSAEDWNTWLTSLEMISNLNLEYIVPGHGSVISGNRIPIELSRIRTIIETAIKNNKAPTSE